MKKIILAVWVIFVSSLMTAIAADNPLQNIVLAPSLTKPYTYNVQQTFIQELSEMNMVSGIITEAEQHILFTSKNNTAFIGKSSCSFAKTKIYGMAMAGIADTVVNHRNNALYSDIIIIGNKCNIMSFTKDISPNVNLENPNISAIISAAFRGSTMLFIPLPEHGITVGSTWIKEADGLLGNISGPLSIKDQKSMIEYTLIGKQDTLGVSCYIVDIKSKDFLIKQQMRQMNIDIAMEGEGMVKGRYYIDQKTGMTVIGSMKIEADIGLAVKEQESAIASMNISFHYICKKKD
ncbi:MAG: hypothetical protein IPK11_06940 [Ignavibacteria bacterium]|nr:hypothetical protein [Ignavibacteria bacterium]